MAARPGSGNLSKPSFAKVAAMAASFPPPTPPTSKPRISEKQISDAPQSVVEADNLASQTTPIQIAQQRERPKKTGDDTKDDLIQLNRAMNSVSIQSNDHKTGGGTSPNPPMLDDQQSQLSLSSAKQSSTDEKSNASALTFGMEEKESLRPDDSASVQAIDDDGSVSGAAVSPSRPEGNQVSQQPDHKRPKMVAPHPSTVVPGNVDCLIQEPPQHSVAYAASEISSVAGAPDEKLLEALSVPKDRLLLLGIEEKLLMFLQNSKDQKLEMPLPNSFARLLAHKLADYYNLLHVVGGDSNSVVVYRSDQSRLPPSIGMLAGSLNQSTPAAMRIISRTKEAFGKTSNTASTPTSSSVPSKTTSEAGVDTTSDEGPPSPAGVIAPKDKSKMTREEREEHYKVVRERIFRDSSEGVAEFSSAGDQSNDMSRSSSASGKKKSHKPKPPKDDSFDSRSNFRPWYPGMAYTSHNHSPESNTQEFSGYQPTHPITAPGTNPFSQGYPQVFHQSYPSPYDTTSHYNTIPQFAPAAPYQQHDYRDQWQAQQYPQNMAFFNMGQSMQNIPPIQQQSPSAFSPYNHSAAPPMSNSTSSWMQGQLLSGAYQQQPNVQQNPPPLHWPAQSTQTNIPTPYPYGQLPPQPQNGGRYSTSPHPLPGSFPGSSFNPNSRSFTPGSSSMRPGQRNTSRNASLTQPPKSVPNRPSMTSDSPLGSVHVSPNLNQNQSVSQSNMIVAPSNLPAPPAQDSLQKKWGTPAHLPKKPPPSEIPPAFDIDKTSSLPSQQSFSPLASGIQKGNGALAVSGATGY